MDVKNDSGQMTKTNVDISLQSRQMFLSTGVAGAEVKGV